MSRPRLTPAQKQTRAQAQAADAAAAAKRIAAALNNNQPVPLDDAKVLEAAGCWIRRNVVA